jgi:hypothetical protein
MVLATRTTTLASAIATSSPQTTTELPRWVFLLLTTLVFEEEEPQVTVTAASRCRTRLAAAIIDPAD